jgi:hypothetical protein
MTIPLFLAQRRGMTAEDMKLPLGGILWGHPVWQEEQNRTVEFFLSLIVLNIGSLQGLLKPEIVHFPWYGNC